MDWLMDKIRGVVYYFGYRPPSYSIFYSPGRYWKILGAQMAINMAKGVRSAPVDAQGRYRGIHEAFEKDRRNK